MTKIFTVILLFMAGMHAEALFPGRWFSFYTPTLHAILAVTFLLFGYLQVRDMADRSRR